MVENCGLDRSKVVNLDLGGAAFKQNAWKHLAEWAVSPPFYVPYETHMEVICARYADAQEVFLDTERFSSELPKARGFEKFDKFMGIQVLAQMDGSAHSRLRKLLMPAFSSSNLAHLETEITRLVDRMLDEIESGGRQFDAMTDFGAKIIVGALLEAMLRLDEEQKKVFLAFHEVLPLTTYRKPGEPYPEECILAFSKAHDMVEKIIRERRVNPGSDFISQLIIARDEGEKLSDEELFNQTFTVCGAALSATTRSMGGVLFTLYSHPEQLAVLRQNLQLMPAAIEECLRFAAGGYFTFPRIATRDTEINGTFIAKGMVVRPSPQAANLDPEVFPDPLRFDVRRNPRRILTFGAGPHLCIGNRLGKLAATIAVSRLITRFPNARLKSADFQPTYTGAVGELRIAQLPMITH